jgi:hypothetical protein
MRKRLVRTLVFIVVALGVAIGAASAAGAIDLTSSEQVGDGISWGWGGSAAGPVTPELAAA